MISVLILIKLLVIFFAFPSGDMSSNTRIFSEIEDPIPYFLLAILINILEPAIIFDSTLALLPNGDCVVINEEHVTTFIQAKILRRNFGKFLRNMVGYLNVELLDQVKNGHG